MLEESAARLILLHRAGELGQVLELAAALRRAVGLEHSRITALVEHQPRKLAMTPDAELLIDCAPLLLIPELNRD
ncbi:MAG: hypothetical protein QOI38_902 [Sphingomonadales bacterium]|nr:hypothetical protein [Sphingomonadales bacterium]